MKNIALLLTQYFGLALVVLVSLLLITPATVSAANVTCGDGTVVTVPDQDFGDEDNLLIRQEACNDFGGYGSSAIQNGECDKNKSILGIPTWYKYLQVEKDQSGRCSPVLSWTDQENKTEQQVNSALPIGIAVLEILLRLSGLVAVVMIFIGAFKFILSQGSPDSAASARKTVINAIIGLIIVIISTGIVSWLGGRLGG